METLRVVEAAGMVGIGSKEFQYDYDESGCSTPYVSAPSSPGRVSGGGFFFSAPASPVRLCRFENSKALCDFPALGKMEEEEAESSAVSPGGSDFEFSARFTDFEGGAVSADELFCNGQILPMKVAAARAEAAFPVPVLEVGENQPAAVADEGSRGRDRGLRRENSSRHRRTRSLSPLRSAPQWATEATEPNHDEETKSKNSSNEVKNEATKQRRSGSKRWISLKDFLYRSKSEGRGHTRERLWAPLSFSLSEKHSKGSKKAESSASKAPDSKTKAVTASKKAENGTNSSRRSSINGIPVAGRRTPVSAHELHYTANRAQAEELKRKTFLPYRQGLLGCLGFSSKSYSTVNGLARTLHPLS